MDELEGVLERTVYFNEESGYTVARVRVRGYRGSVTVVGKYISASPGETLKLTGEWVVDKRYGQQFQVAGYRSVIPATAHGIEKFLASGLVKGIGPEMASRLVKKFGAKTLEVIERKPESLLSVEGIGPARVASLRDALKEHREIRELMLFLQGHDLPVGLAGKLFKQYGERAVAVLKEDPYRLAEEVFGIGFKTADRVAMRLGLPPDSPSRIQAGIIYLLNVLAGEGHVYYPRDALITKGQELLQVEPDAVQDGIAQLKAPERDRVVVEELPEGEGVYLTGLHAAEVNVGRRLGQLMHFPVTLRLPLSVEGAIAEAERLQGITLSPKQREAVARMLASKLLIITGGPGTGKTTLVKTFLIIAEHLARRVLLAAPTGRAAKRLAETTGREAKTIHRLLEYQPATGTFKRDQGNLLRGDTVLIDEASMVDLVLMNHLLKAVPITASLILVGDVDQLPSVGPGNVLRELIGAGSIEVVRLTEVFRQARESYIILNAHRVNRGEFPLMAGGQENGADFYFLEKEEPGEILELILKLCTERIPERFGFHPMDDVQVLAPMHRGVVGAMNLNQALRNALNPGGAELPLAGRSFRVGDKVMQLRNNYELEVFNGDIGRIEEIVRDEQQVTIRFYDRLVTVEFKNLDDLALAYAITVHKSQGSEYPAIILPLITQHYMMLQRNLLYTAITRARRLMVLIGTKKAVAMAIKNDKIEKRYTNLRARLAGAG